MTLANTAPTAVRLSPVTAAANASAAVAENAAGAVIGTLSTIDPNAGDAFTYSVSDSRFEVAGSTLKLKAGVALNYEAARFINIAVTAFDRGGLSKAQAFAVAVTNVNEGPTAIRLSGSTVTENAAGAAIGTLTVVDPDAGDSHRFALSDDRFEVVGTTLKLKTGVALDYEAAATVALTVTATDAGGLSRAQAFSIRVSDVAEPPGGNSTPTGAVAISGTAQQGQTLTASNTLADADGLGTVSYQWRADGVAISGATGSSLTLTQAEVGKAISVTAAYTDGRGTAEAVASAATAAVQNVNDAPTGAVTISGTAAQGQVLTASNTLADVDGLGTINYQWQADGVAISGATGSSLTLTQAEVGKAISVTASYTDDQGTAEAVASAATAAVQNVNDAPTGAVTISGTAAQGHVLTASNSLADADGLGTISYQWQADGVAIGGATGASLTLTQAEVGKAISVTASYTDGQGTAEAVASAATALVANINDPATITGDTTGTVAEDGVTQTVSGTLVVSDPDADQSVFAVPSSLAGTYGSFSLDAATGAWSYTLDSSLPAVQALTAADQVTDSLTITSLDGTASATVTVTIDGTNDPAVITGDTTGTVAEDGATQSVSGTLSVSDPDAGEASFAVPGSLAGLYGSFSLDAATGAWSYTLDSSLPAVQALTAADQVTDSLTITSLDGTASASITVTIDGTSDPAVIIGDTTGMLAEDGATQSVSGTLVVSDPDADQAVFATPGSLVGTYGSFSLDAATGAWSYTLDNTLPEVQALTAADQVTDSLTITSLDGTASASITVTVEGADDPAVITGDTTGTVAEDGEVQGVSGTLFVSDPDAGEAGFAMPGALMGLYGSFSLDAATGAWSYTLDSSLPAVQALTAADQVTDSLTITSLDGTASATLTITIEGADDPAAITGDTTGTVAEDGEVQSVSGTLFVSDPDAGQAGFVMPGSLAGWFGNFTFDPATGAWSYTLDNSRAEVQALTAADQDFDFLTVSALDGSLTETILITIGGADDLAEITGDTTGTVQVGALQSVSGSLSVSDLDAGEAGFAMPTSLAGWFGSFTFDVATGAWSYTLDDTLQSVQDLPSNGEDVDFLTVSSLDGTASETILVTIHGSDWIG